MRKIAGYKIHLDKLSALIKVFYNIIASILPSVVLQLLIYPAYSGFVSQKQYGNMITILSILTVIAISVGNALNNVRLLRQNEYFEAGQHGDYLCEAGQGDGAGGPGDVSGGAGGYFSDCPGASSWDAEPAQGEYGV